MILIADIRHFKSRAGVSQSVVYLYGSVALNNDRPLLNEEAFMDIKTYVLNKAKEAKEGARALAKASSGQKNNALVNMAEALQRRAKELISENVKDVKFAEGKGLSKALIDRLTLNGKRINEMAQGLVEVAALPDPVGEIVRMWRRPNGVTVGRRRVRAGVIG